MELVIATSNPHKITELTPLLRPARWTIRTGADFPDAPDPEETGATYEENALIKARAWAEATGLPALADDSGLEVEALGGRPGIHSSRYAPTAEARIDKLLEALREIPGDRRRARFVCVIAFVDPGGASKTFQGICPGAITRSRSGGHGFGYDPVFLVDGCGGRTMAELTPEEKNTLSHRARAAAALLEAFGAPPPVG